MTSRFLFILFLLITFAVPARAADQAIADAVAYYDHCVGTAWPDMSRHTREDFCACASEHARTVMTHDEMAFLTTGQRKRPPGGAYSPLSEPAPVDEAKLMTKVLGPCLGAPIREEELGACLFSENNINMFRTEELYQAMCGCVADGAKSFFDDAGGEYISYLLASKPDLKNVLTTIQGDYTYRKDLGKVRNKCLNDYAFK